MFQNVGNSLSNLGAIASSGLSSIGKGLGMKEKLDNKQPISSADAGKELNEIQKFVGKIQENEKHVTEELQSMLRDYERMEACPLPAVEHTLKNMSMLFDRISAIPNGIADKKL